MKDIIKTMVFAARRFKYRSQKSNLTFQENWKEINYNRIAIINALITKTNFQSSYLEIGCQDNLLFDAVPIKSKIGVDPERGGTHRMTSDEFFIKDQSRFDLIFIDGLHTIDQVIKDVENSISRLNKDGFIVIHDLLPRRWSEQTEKPADTVWLGDVWKLSDHFQKHPDYYSFFIVNVDHGVGILQINEGVNQPRIDAAQLKTLTYDDFEKLKRKLQILTFDEFLQTLSSR